MGSMGRLCESGAGKEVQGVSDAEKETKNWRAGGFGQKFRVGEHRVPGVSRKKPRGLDLCKSSTWLTFVT